MANAGNLGIGVFLDDKQVIQGLKKLNRQWRGFATDVKSVMDIASRGVGILASAIGGVTSALTEASKAAIKFERSVAEVTTIANEAAFSTGKIRDITFDLAKVYGSDVTSNAKALYQTISAGVTDAKGATELLNQAQVLAIGGVTDVETAVSGLTSVLNAYKDQGLTAKEATDALFVAVKDGTTTAGQLAASLGQVTSMASQSGLAFDELLAAVATLTQRGISTSEAVTQVRSVLVALTKQTDQSVQIQKDLNIEFSLAALQTKGLAKLLDELVNKSGASSEQLNKLFGRVEGYTAAVALAANDSEVFNEKLGNMTTKAGASDQALQRMSKTTGHQVDRFNALSDAATTAFGTMVVEGLAAEGVLKTLNTTLSVAVDLFRGKDTTATSGILLYLKSLKFLVLADSPLIRGVTLLIGALKDVIGLTARAFQAASDFLRGPGLKFTQLVPDTPQILAPQVDGQNSVLLDQPEGTNTVLNDFVRRGGGKGRNKKGRSRRPRDVTSSTLPASVGGFSLGALSEAGELAGQVDSFGDLDLATLAADGAEAAERRIEQSAENIRRFFSLMREHQGREFDALTEQMKAQVSDFEGAEEGLRNTIGASLNIFSAGVSDVITAGIQAAVLGKEDFGNVLKEMTGGLLTNIGSQMIAMGSSALITQALALIPWMQPLTGPPNAGAAAAGAAAVAFGGGLVAAGAGISGAGAPTVPSVGRGGSGGGGNASAFGIGQRRSTRSNDNGFAGPALEGALAFGGDSPVQINVNFNRPVTSPRRAAREIQDLLGQGGTLNPLRRRGGAFV